MHDVSSAMSWSLEDLGSYRRVRGGGAEVATPLSAEYIHQLGQFRNGLELVDELLRSEHPPYIYERLAVLLAPFPLLSTWTVLDYGCGAGASSVVLARLGIGSIVGVDAVNEYGDIWKRRLAECGYPNVGVFVRVFDTLGLPFAKNSFDAVFLNGVLEHLLLEERGAVLREALRVTKDGGHIVIAETPNRLFPRHSHTKLWFSELLPDWLAARYAIAFGLRGDFPRSDRVSQYRTGYRGMSVHQITKILGSTVTPLPCDHRLAEMEFTLPRNPLEASSKRVRLGRFAWRLVRAIAKILRMPPCALAPHINLVLQKRQE